MTHPLLALPVSLAIILVSTAFGRVMLSLLKVKAVGAEKSVFGMGLGLGVLAYLVLGAGLLGCLDAWTPAIIVGLMAAVSAREARAVLGESVAWVKSRGSAKPGAGDALITLSVVSLGSLALVSALAPPGGLDWDGLAYHLAVPKIYLENHRILYIPFTSHSNFPFLTEMLYTLGLSLGSVGIAKLFHFSMYIGTAVALYTLGTRHVSPLAGKLAALIFMSVPVVFYEAWIAYADLTMAFYILLAVYALLNWEDARSTPWPVVCGLMGGFALGTKVLAAVPIFALCVWAVGVQRRLRPALTVGLTALAVGSVWYIKTFLYTGNPVYPFMYEVFGGRNWSQAAAEAYRIEQSSFGLGKSLGSLFFLPWNLLVKGIYFSNSPDPKNPNIFTLLGPAFVGLLPVYLLAGRYAKPVLKILAVGVVFTAAWFVLMQHSRYLVAVVPLFALAAGACAESALSWRYGKWAVRGLLAVCMLVTLYPAWMVAGSFAGVAFGFVPAEEYLSQTLDVYDSQVYINENTPESARVVLFDEVRGFYLDRPYIWGNPNHHEMIPWADLRTGKAMVEWFRDNGYTHALVNWKFAGRDDFLHGTLMLQAIGRGYMQEVYASRGVSVYEFGEGWQSENP